MSGRAPASSAGSGKSIGGRQLSSAPAGGSGAGRSRLAASSLAARHWFTFRYPLVPLRAHRAPKPAWTAMIPPLLYVPKLS